MQQVANESIAVEISSSNAEPAGIPHRDIDACWYFMKQLYLSICWSFYIFLAQPIYFDLDPSRCCANRKPKHAVAVVSG